MLNIANLTLGYQGKPVLALPALNLAAGSQCLITGASGSGKTTLLYAIAGLVPVMGGTIGVNGTDIAGLSESARDRFRGQHIGMVFQALHLVKSLSVMNNLLLADYVANRPQRPLQALAALAALGIDHKRDALPETLSQGQAQRVAIARAIMPRPSLILADEPTSSLDDANCAAVIALLQQAATDSGATLIISTHDARVKAHFADVIHLGQAA